jgi:putative flippase GtrA
MKIVSSVLPERSRARIYEIVLFVIVGFLNTAVDFTVLNLLIFLTHRDSGLWLIAFTCLGFLAAVINSYVLNGRLTFRGQMSSSSHNFLRFIAVNAVGMVINSVIVWFVVLLIGSRLPVLVAINVSKVLAISCSLSWNYFAIRRWVLTGQRAYPTHGVSSSQPISTVSAASITLLERDGIENQLHSSLSQGERK